MSKTRTSNGKRGGLLEGKPHYDKDGNSLGGIKAVVTDAGGKPVELEGGEVIINKEASKKYWKELSKINQSAGNGVPILPPDGAVTDEDPEEFSEGGNIIEFNPNHLPNKWITEYAKQIKKDHPEIWKKGGNIFGNEAFVNLVRVRERGHWLDSEEWMYIKWRSYVARHKKDFRIEGVVAMLKWCDKVDKGWGYMKTLIEKEIATLEKKKKPSAFKQAIKEKSLFKDGGKVSKTNDSCQVLDKDGNPAIDDKSLRKMEKCIMKLTQTKDMNLNANGKYKLARRKLHKKIIDEFKKNAVCITKGQPIAILMGGSPASGKSSFLRKYRPFLLQEEILKVDADEIRAKLPEYKGYNATQTHQETKDIVTTLISDRNIGVPCDFDLIYDGTMNNVRSYKPLIELLRSRNYKIFIVYMDKVPKEVIMQRMKDRYLKTGRFVPAEVVDDFFKKGTSAFEELKPLVDGYLVIDGSNQDYDIIEKGGMQLPEDRAYSKLGQKISAEELEKIEYKRGGNLDKIDSVELDIPLLIRVMEFAREDVKSDPELHHVVERLIEIRDKGVLTMKDYDFIADLKKKEKFSEIERKYANGGAVLLAPNGNPSNLTPKQHKLVRTPDFKAWFGDWENDPENASKVVDENGEPLVLFHGTNRDFNVFNEKKIGLTDKGWYGYGYYFSPSTQMSDLYGKSKPYFIKIKKIFNTNKENPFYLGGKDVTENYITKGYEGASKTFDVNKLYHEYCVFFPFSNNIKLADGTNTTFDPNSDDIRFETGGNIEQKLKDLKGIPYNELLKNIQDSYKELGAEVGVKGHTKDGEPIIGYLPYQYDYMHTSDITNKKIRFFIDLGEGKLVHPSEVNPKFSVSEQKRLEQTADQFYRNGLENYKTSIENLKKNQELDLVKESLSKALNNGFEIENQYDGNDYFESNGSSILVNNKNGIRLNISKYIERINGEAPKTKLSNLDLLKFKKEYLDKFEKGGLIAPNGKPSNLTPEQHKLVRTPEFKAWFGDWENDPENASKVVDENGEPLVVFHGSSEKFYTFDKKKIGQNYIESQRGGFFFTQKIKTAENYATLHSENKSKGFVYECFLNIKSPIIRRTNSDYYKPIENYDINRGEYIRELFINKKLSGIIIYGTRQDNLYVVRKSNQIKLADGTNTTFDPNNDDIRFETGGAILLAPNGNPSNLNTEQYKLVRTPEFKAWFGDWENYPENASKVVDSNGEPLVVYHGTPYGGFYEFDLNSVGKSTIPYWGKGIYTTASKFYAKGYAESKRTETQKIYDLFLKCINPYIVKRHLIGRDAYMKMVEENQYNDFNDFLDKNGFDSVIILDGDTMNDAIEIMTPFSNQIKLADGTNTTFDSNNDDIRFENGGYIEDYGDYKIEVENEYEYIVTALKNGKRVGLLTFLRNPYTSKNGELYILVDRIDVNEKERGYGLATKMYQYALKHLPKKYKGIASDLKNRINKNEIPKIYSKFNNKIESSGGVEYHLINNPDIRFEIGGTVLLAPNGNPSNLTPEQHKLVRTPEFKAWFGDWENDPENASKVVDENGEPKVVFHGSKSFEIQEFDLSKSKRKSSGLKEYGTYFTDNIKLAEAYKNWGVLKEEEEQKIDAEINLLKEVLEKARNNRDFDSAEQKIKQLKEIKKGKIYSLFLNLKKMQSFDAKGEVNIEAWNNLEVKASYKWASNRDAMYFLKEGKFGVEKVDGIEAKNIVDAFVQTDELKKQLLSNVYLVFDSQNIKLADGTNTTFDGNNPDIRFENGGTVDLASFNKNSKTELKKGDYQHLQTRDEKRKAITFLYAMEYYAKNSIVPLAEPDNEESIYWQRVSINDKEYIVGFDLSFYDFKNPLKITEAIVTFYDENYNELDNPNTQYKQGGNLPNEKYLTLYHGTILKNLPKIEKNGLVSNLGYSAGWYMLSTDFESALYHANTINEGDKVPVIEFHIPITKTERWEGYPYVWTEEKRNDKSSWYAPMQEIPKEFIHKIHYVSYKNWLKQKAESFETGGRTTAQTPAPSKERIYGSEKNKPRSSKDSSSAESIKFDKKTLTSIENKLKEHNESHPDVKVNLATAKAVVRRGMGAYSKSHRPTISGGKPNSRVAWGLARLNAFLYKAVHGESKSGKYSQDNDLLDELSIAHDKFKTGGEIPKKNKNGNCYEKAGKMILYANTKYYPKIDYIGKPYLVHAQVTGQGAIEGVKYGHAWIEDDAFVYDYSNKRKLKVPKALYYEIGQIIEQQPIHFKYTFEQARRKMNEIGHYGSWDLITESGL